MLICRFSPNRFDLFRFKRLLNHKVSYLRITHKYNEVTIQNIFRYVATGVQSPGAFSGFRAKTKEYSGRKLIGFSMDQMYEVVADVKEYKNFIPFCKQSEVLIQEPEFLKAKLVIGFPPVTESYTSEVTLNRPRLVRAECSDGTLFEHLVTAWQFSPGLRKQPQTCVVDFFVSFKFKSSLHSHLAHLFFNELVRQMESAFFDEARRRYGNPIIHTLKLVQHKH